MRKAEVGYWKSKQGYYTTYHGERHRLRACGRDDSPDGPDYLSALEAFVALMRGQARRGETLGSCLERWLAHQGRSNARTAAVSRGLLRGLAEALGAAPVAGLAPYQLLGWIDARGSWCGTTKGVAFARLKTCLAWNRRLGHVAADPLAAVRRPDAWRSRSRGVEAYLPDDLVRLILGAGAAGWRDYLLGLARTGARPGELAGAGGEHYRSDEHVIVLARHKTAGRCRQVTAVRTIQLDGQVEAIVRRNASRGRWLFPGPRGRSWGAVLRHQRWRRTLSAAAVSEWLAANRPGGRPPVLYALRHTYVTRQLLKGTSPALVAAWCGTSIAMLQRHYSHVGADRAALRRAFLDSV